MIKLGLVGPMRAGKDTMADWLVKNRDFKRFAVADRIKTAYFAFIGYSAEKFEQDKGALKGQEMRAGLWEYSDCIKAHYGERVFIDHMLEEAESCGSSVVVTDVRTAQEVSAMTSFNAFLILVTRGEAYESPDDLIAGSRLKIRQLPPNTLRFDNSFSTLEEAHEALEAFYDKEIRNVA